MTEHIVDLLETVKGETQYGKRYYPPLGHLDRAGEMLREGRAVRQICQGVVVRQMLDAGLCLLALGNILRKAQEVARLAHLGRYRVVRCCQYAFTIVMGINYVLVYYLQVARMRGLAATWKQCVRDLLVGRIVDMFADQIAAHHAEDGFGGPVEEYVALVSRVLDRDRNRHVLDDGVEKVLGTAELGSTRIECFELAEMNE